MPYNSDVKTVSRISHQINSINPLFHDEEWLTNVLWLIWYYPISIYRCLPDDDSISVDAMWNRRVYKRVKMSCMEFSELTRLFDIAISSLCNDSVFDITFRIGRILHRSLKEVA